MTTALGPRPVLPPGTAVPFAVLAACWVPVAIAGSIWVGGHLASWVSGQGWSGPGFGGEFVELLVTRGPAPSWPTTPVGLVWLGTGLVLALPIAAITTFVVWWRRPGRPDAPERSLGSGRDVAAMVGRQAAVRARKLRPTLTATGRTLAASEVGVRLGHLRSRRPGARGTEVRASWEDVLLAVMAPRAGKTSALAIPSILQAPGAVVATSNKADLWAATASQRAQRTGQQVWVFDPQQITYADRTWWWNPLRAVTTVEESHRLAGHFITEIRTEHSAPDFWTAAAHDLLTGLFLAAGTSSRDLTEVYEWLNDPANTTPADLLRASGHRAAAASLLGRLHGAPETRDGIYETARTAAQCLRDDAILAWVTPPAAVSPATSGIEELDADTIPASRQTVYLLSKDGAGAAAPLVAALTDRILRAATRAAERAGGRLDPPLLVVLDEAANICRIADLPDLYSHLGSRGITPITILQSYKQGVRVWGEHGMDTLWSAATVKLIGAGLDDARLAEDLSRLIGEHDVPVRSLNYGDRHVSETLSLRRQRILGPEHLRALPRGTALLLATGTKATLLRLAPWYAAPDADTTHAAIAAATKNLTERASRYHPVKAPR